MTSLKARITENIQRVRERIANAASRVNRDASKIQLLVVSKSRTADEINIAAQALMKLNLPVIFGENYWQELSEKLSKVQSEVRFQFIGRLQSNKIKDLVDQGILIQTAASRKHIDSIQKISENMAKTLDIYIQVNASNDPKKAGFTIEQAKIILDETFKNIKIAGLMTIPELVTNKEESRVAFRALRLLRANRDLKLSMGMSDDLEIAIEEGADIVRVGTAIFGERQRKL